ncbi:hypothetical protein [Grimontia hollisae]|uniref:Uncharacterized protein n=2 Tax=Grimontia hollisae TaxID=673 RepID=D0I5V1_GRIHO|nr:hypothetical protein [Grimontia hollisae]EEY73265.1 hypothetical protein VHA_001118 [Grimontia hollisae CIP 101886]MDF2185003.1 hypothetical protein [Grimontia hollisae]STO76826.1 Uncharacterised protein [Grimontia hollisae]STO98150.1 Uncharacterised protein [Grimontia hollisae]STQ76034.1 Uncharacterised protein [Grimontia hollisae]
MMEYFKAPLLAASLLFALPTYAAPELVPATMLAYGHYEKVEEVTISGDINENIVNLAENRLTDNEADLYVIDEISEDIERNMLVLNVSLYNDLNQGIVTIK